jgi:hypothetical protein
MAENAANDRRLKRLRIAYPAFTFSREVLGHRGVHWVAERRDRSAPGLIVAITDDVMKLHAALQRDKGAPPRVAKEP